MIADESIATIINESLNEKWGNESGADEVSMIDYQSFLQTDDGEYDNLDDFDDDDFFESSQLHRLIHTQPIHLINQNTLFGYASDTLYIQPQDIHTTTSTIDTSSPLKNPQSAATSTSRSSSLFSTVHPSEEEKRAASASYDFFESMEEAMDNFDEPLTDHKHDSDPLNSSDGKLQLHLNTLIPRSLPHKKVDLKLPLDFGSFSKQQEVHLAANETNYHYSIKHSSHRQQQQQQQALDEKALLLRTLNVKLSRYAGYYTSDSKDQEYSDKVRFQEISYKFSKTYF